MRRLLVALGALLLGWFGATSPVSTSAAASSPDGVHAYVYSDVGGSPLTTARTAERGPPAKPGRTTSCDADGHRPRGESPRSDGASAPPLCAYDAGPQPAPHTTGSRACRRAVPRIGTHPSDHALRAEIHTYFVGGASVLVHNCAMQKSPNAIARAWGYSTRQIKNAIEQVKQEPGWRGFGANRNPDVFVHDATGEVYPQLPDGTPADDSIGNLYDYLPEDPW